MSQEITRLAPSPTGALHLGNARTFVVNYLLRPRAGWRGAPADRGPRRPADKAGATGGRWTNSRWLGLDWDGPVVVPVAAAQRVYQAALEQLIATAPPTPARAAARTSTRPPAAPHQEDGAGVYPGTCRGRWASAEHAAKESGRPVAWRVHVPDGRILFSDAFAGVCEFNLAETCGDFVVFRNDGTAAYQLAVVVDDEAAQVTQIVRGDDLLESAARQIHLRRLLGLASDLTYWHLPLVVGPDGRRLAKRHGDTRLEHYRQGGVPAERVLGLIGYWSGLLESRGEASLNDLLARFDPQRIPHERIVFASEDEAFLRSGAK